MSRDPGEIPWGDIFRFFAEKYSWDATKVAGMSLATIRGYIRASSRDGRQMTNHAEVMDFVRRRRAALGIGE